MPKRRSNAANTSGASAAEPETHRRSEGGDASSASRSRTYIVGTPKNIVTSSRCSIAMVRLASKRSSKMKCAPAVSVPLSAAPRPWM